MSAVETLEEWLASARALELTDNMSEVLDKLRKITSTIKVHIQETDGEHLVVLSSQPAAKNNSSQPAAKNNSSMLSDLQEVCNGVVLEYPSFNLVAMPTPVLVWECPNEVWSDIGKYTIYEALDGSVVTLYFRNGEWRLSSANGASVGDYTRLDANVNYMQALRECFEMYPKFKWDLLNQSYCYNVGFKHSAFHPLNTPNRAWVVGYYYLGGSEPEPHAPIGLPSQPKYQQGKNVRSHIKNTTATSLQSYLNNGRPNYGYILARGNTRILIESTLMSFVRNAVYNVPKGLYDNGKPRSVYFSLRAYLRVKTKSKFIRLFPQYKPLYDSFDAFFNTLTSKVMREDNSGTKLDVFASYAAKQLRDVIDITDINSAGVILDFLTNQELLNTYMSMIMEQIK